MEKEKNLRLVILVGIIFLLLQILQIIFNIPFIFIFAIMVISIIIIAVSKPKIPTLNKTTALEIILLLAVAIIILMFVNTQVPKSLEYFANRTSEGFGDNEYNKDYVYYFDDSGQASIQNERLLVFGTVSIINNDVSYQNPEFGFDILVGEGKVALVEIIFRDVDVTTETSFNFTVGHYYIWQRIKFGVDDQNQVWVEAHGRDPQNLEMRSAFFNTNVPYNVIIKVTGDNMRNRCAVNIDNINIGK